jgi:hypothetical protein
MDSALHTVTPNDHSLIRVARIVIGKVLLVGLVAVLVVVVQADGTPIRFGCEGLMVVVVELYTNQQECSSLIYTDHFTTSDERCPPVACSCTPWVLIWY